MDRTGVIATKTGERADVYLHIGLPKTGTSHVQHVLWLSRKQLARDGVLVPGSGRQSQRHAVWDLLGRRQDGVEQPEVAGSWRRLAEAAAGWDGSRVLVSEEFLTNATPRQVRRVVRDLEPARVHVVVTARDLGQVVGSVWQQELSKGRTWTWSEFVSSVRDPDDGPASAGLTFWLQHDLVRVLDVWETAVPRERVHVVVVPRPGAPEGQLVERFAAAAGLEAGSLRTGRPSSNVSVGAAEAEVLRRLNGTLDGRLNERQYAWAVQQGVKRALRTRRSSPRIELADAERVWITGRAESMLAEVRARGYDVSGDLAELVPAAADGLAVPPDAVSEAEVTDAAITALSALTEKYAELRWEHRDQDGEGAANGPQVASTARAAGYRARKGVLRLADRSRLVRRAVNAYARRR